MTKLSTAGLLLVKQRKLLLAFSRNKQCFYLPGGKIDAGESAEQALCREVLEELNTEIQPGQLIYYTHISAPAYGEENGVMMEQDCFFTTIDINPQPSGEIEEIRYFSLEDYLQEKNRAPGAVMILEKLKMEGLID